ncbi:MAG: hypothetical protein ACJ8DZ_13930 [Allosphingosinicella sp.]
MRCLLQTSTTEIWHDVGAGEFYAYAGGRLIRVCPSEGMAREVLAGL